MVKSGNDWGKFIFFSFSPFVSLFYGAEMKKLILIRKQRKSSKASHVFGNFSAIKSLFNETKG